MKVKKNEKACGLLVVDGLQAQDLVKRRLWSHGYRVKDVSLSGIAFDLITDKGVRIEVKASAYRKAGWRISQVYPEHFDLLICVLEDSIFDGNFTVFYCKNKKLFENDKNKIGFLLKKDDLVKHFTKSVREVLEK